MNKDKSNEKDYDQLAVNECEKGMISTRQKLIVGVAKKKKTFLKSLKIKKNNNQIYIIKILLLVTWNQ